jgi:cation-transporting ATPase E
MTGDGVNDVLALKSADLGIAMGSGTSAARGVAQLVLLDDAFSAVPKVVAEGRRVIANLERVANLFLTKTVYATVLALTVGVVGLPFPFLPRHLTLVSGVTIGIPGFFLALAPNALRARRGFLGRVLRFAIPAGVVAAAATFAAYSLARSEPSTSLESARTVATLVLAGVALWVLSILTRPANRARQWLIASMVGLLVAALVLPWSRDFFALNFPRPVLWLAGVGVAGLAGLALEGGWLAAGSVQELFARLRRRRSASRDKPGAAGGRTVSCRAWRGETGAVAGRRSPLAVASSHRPVRGPRRSTCGCPEGRRTARRCRRNRPRWREPAASRR